MTKDFRNQVSEGMDVFDADDQKVGSVSEKAEGYLRVPTGFLDLGTEHLIPFSAIREVKGREIHLNVAKDRLGELVSDDAQAYDGTTVERTTTTTTTATDVPKRQVEGEQTLQLREEELTARKSTVQTGEVTLSTEVVSEQRTIEVPVTREEVTIDRHAVDRRPSDRPIAETSETISIPVSEEQVTAEKRAVVYEEVEVGKRAVQETKHVSETVRREEAVIDKEGNVEIAGESSSVPRPPR